MEPVIDKAIIGWRKLIFGLTSVICAGIIEYFVPGGWSKAGMGGLVGLNALFYGPPVLKEVRNIVDAWKNGGKPVA